MSLLPCQPHPAARPCLTTYVNTLADYFITLMNYTSNRLFFALLLLISLVAAVPTAAQEPPARLLGLAVELWPDYDRPAMLVLLTAELPADATLPATLTIPVPTGADIHAVASFNEAGALMSDVDYSVNGDQMTLTTPVNRFRVEYYTPYEAEGDDYSYVFEWVSALDIEQVTVVVQQPLAAVDFTIDPPASGTAAERGDNLTYYTLPPRSLAAGELFTVTVNYTVEAPVLSAPTTSAVTGDTPGTTPAAPARDFNPLWLLAGAAALALIGGAWYLGRQQGQAAGRTRKPQPARPAKSKSDLKTKKAAAPPAKPAAPARFCHNCGQRARPDDAYCRSCGVELKRN